MGLGYDRVDQRLYTGKLRGQEIDANKRVFNVYSSSFYQIVASETRASVVSGSSNERVCRGRILFFFRHKCAKKFFVILVQTKKHVKVYRNWQTAHVQKFPSLGSRSAFKVFKRLRRTWIVFPENLGS